MDKQKASDLIAVGVIVLLGLFTAYVTFGILQSNATAETAKYSLGGAVAGALVAMSMFFSAYRQFRKSSGEVEKLQDRIQELQQKVIRGAPCPKFFEIEVDERLRIVLAKPQKWEPRGGTIFDFEIPVAQLRPGDAFPAKFNVTYLPIESDDAADKYYEKTLKLFDNPAYVNSYSGEFIKLGGEMAGIKSLKVLFQQFVRIQPKTNWLTGKEQKIPVYISKQEFETGLAQQKKDETPAPPPETGALAVKIEYLRVWQMQVICFHPDLKKIFIFRFDDDEKDFTESSALFNQVLNSIRFLT